jgi:AcrR family transcriptional regulator
LAQVKKASVRDAIEHSAFALFKENGYAETTLAHIGAGAGVTVSNIYNYFDSKLDILYAVYDPWLEERLDRLVAEVSGIEPPRDKLKAIFLALFRDIPAEDGGFVNNLLQALSARQPGELYSSDLLLRSEARISAILRDIVPPGNRRLAEDDLFSHLLFMAFDGFAVHYKLRGKSRRAEDICDMLSDLILADPGLTDPGHREKLTQEER